MPDWLIWLAEEVARSGPWLALPLVTWLVARQGRKASAEQLSIENLRKDLETLRQEAETDKAEFEQRYARVEARVRKQADYVHELRDHIVNEKPPPPPPFPDGLYI